MIRLLLALAFAAAPLAARAQHGHAAGDSAHACTAEGCAHHVGDHAGMDHAALHALHHPATYGAAETPVHAAVRAAVVALFDAMRAGSADGIRAAFHPDAVLMTVGAGRDGVLRVRSEEAEAFATAVGTPHDEVYDERLGPVEVRVDGPLATAWTTYRFYVGDRFSHCGVDAFQLADTGDGWKIIAVTDTRRADCEGIDAE